MRVFNVDTRPYGEEKIFSKKKIEIKPGVTVLVGCNGAGKTSLINYIENQLKYGNVPYIIFNNLIDGGSNSRSEALYNDDIQLLASLTCCSEGECIATNLVNLSKKLAYFIKYGKTNDRFSKLNNLMKELITNGDEQQSEPVKERWVLLDAVDSGFSIDNIIDLKEYLLKPLTELDCEGELYIVISANSFEMANGEQCLDVYNGKYTSFNDYEEYKEFILKSRERKEKRYEELEDN